MYIYFLHASKNNYDNILWVIGIYIQTWNLTIPFKLKFGFRRLI